MKLEIYMNWERPNPDNNYIKPHTSCKIEISEEELKLTKGTLNELFKSVSRLIDFSIQFME